MRKTHLLALTAATAAMLALAGCNDDQTAAPAAPAPAAPAAEETTPGEPGTLERLREGVDELAGEARDMTERALEDAGPLLEQAGEIAIQVGQSVEEIVRQGVVDLERAAELLEERIGEMLGERRVVEDAEARLSPEDRLNADTRAAARAVQVGIEPAYIGVWADTAANCARIDQDYVERFAVITPTTIRHVETVCNFEALPLGADGRVTAPAACIAEGDEEDRQITFAMSSPEELRIGHDPAHEGALLLRCHLPG